MKALVIGNPIAGRGKAPRLIDALTRALRAEGLETDVYLTRAAGDARQRAGRIDAGVDRLVVVGGDGTLNEVLNGLTDPSRVPLTQLAMGTANVLAHELRLPRNPKALAAVVAHGRVRQLDLSIANGQRFLSLASAGFDAMVTREVQRRRKGELGYLGYAVPLIRALWSYRPPCLNVSVDGAESVTGAMVVVGNISNYGGLFAVADRARCDDGHLDICVLPRGSRLALTGYALAALARLLSKTTDVIYLTGRRVTIDSNSPVAYEIDGDYAGQTPLEIQLDPRTVPFIVPR